MTPDEFDRLLARIDPSRRRLRPAMRYWTRVPKVVALSRFCGVR